MRKYSQSRSITTQDYNPGPSKVPKYRHPHSASHLAVWHKRVGAKSQIPKSLSISHMLKLWALQKKGRQTESITIESFDVSKKIWIQLGEVPFEVTKQHFGQGGCKRAFIASSDNTLFQSKTWLLKYHESSKKIVDELGTDGECQTRNALKMHCLSSNLAFAFEQLCISSFDSFGQSFSLNKIYYGLFGEEYATIEEYIDQEFMKYANNTGSVFCDGKKGEKAEAFILFPWERSGENFVLLDLQGVGYLLCDPEIPTMDLGLRRVAPKVSFISVWETFQRMKYMDLCQLINATKPAEQFALKNLKISSFREDGEAGKLQKEKKTAYLICYWLSLYFTKCYN